MRFELEINSCGDCVFKTEYNGYPEADYWLCDIYDGYLKITNMTIIHPNCQLGKVICKKRLKPPEDGLVATPTHGR